MRPKTRVKRSMLRALVLVLAGVSASTTAQAATFLEFSWTGQVAGFRVAGEFSYDETNIPTDGVVRRDNLLSFDVSFFDPLGNLLRTYVDNHLNYGDFNFNYDTVSRSILQDGVFSEPDGIDIGEYRVIGQNQATGLNFWSKPRPNAVAHVHFDDWGNEFGFPRAFGGHEDVAFFDFTTQQLVDSTGIGPDYAANPNFPLNATGARMTIAPVPLPPSLAMLIGGLGVIGWITRRRHNRGPGQANLA